MRRFEEQVRKQVDALGILIAAVNASNSKKMAEHVEEIVRDVAVVKKSTGIIEEGVEEIQNTLARMDFRTVLYMLNTLTMETRNVAYIVAGSQWGPGETMRVTEPFGLFGAVPVGVCSTLADIWRLLKMGLDNRLEEQLKESARMGLSNDYVTRARKEAQITSLLLRCFTVTPGALENLHQLCRRHNIRTAKNAHFNLKLGFKFATMHEGEEDDQDSGSCDLVPFMEFFTFRGRKYLQWSCDFDFSIRYPNQPASTHSGWRFLLTMVNCELASQEAWLPFLRWDSLLPLLEDMSQACYKNKELHKKDNTPMMRTKKLDKRYGKARSREGLHPIHYRMGLRERGRPPGPTEKLSVINRIISTGRRFKSVP
ncbi:hypothetical protein BJ508DRAFT_172709 [Ascobolus immersus RN42]|uniref:Uncharacterized protein n=1 Tax=Ascobolus immersus RN42 TaxID=1160509 RepID=A0A3N4HUC1_ASCIM|nr:hypothetical protein BJ508DRAFT_172709 [Ascobolus immersus RN42]